MIKKTIIITAVSMAICTILEFSGIMKNIMFLDKVFLMSLFLLIGGGFKLLSAWNYFTLQKYSFQRVSKRIPFLSTLFLNANAKAAKIESDAPKKEEDEEEPSDYAAYLEKNKNKVKANDALPYLFSFVILTLVSIVVNQFI